MKHTPVTVDPDQFPDTFRPLLTGAQVYDSSCSDAARVWFLDREGGFYLKAAPKGALRKEAEMTRYFHKKGLAAEVLAYESKDRDWLLTARVPGEDCISGVYLEDPVRLCDAVAEQLRLLHDTPAPDCPVPDRTADYLEAARRGYTGRTYDASHFPDSFGYTSAKEAWAYVQQNAHLLQTDTLLHGDYCLPNIILNNWQFSGFIDLDNGGIGDRHVDLFWGIWSLQFNLKTDAYRARFLDAYGRSGVEEDMLRLIAAIEVFG